ncbi:MAG: pyocin knob domain-containing protein [Fusobacterium sp.]|uniref:pyocin knob domain-containing protein n=1 Tax=Fusobacterium sp. TaxID=68766 RepID=UPI003994E607
MSKIITDEQELNTAVDDLVTDDYALEILGLQNIADFRKFSRSFMKLSKIVKRIENSDNNKSEKGHLHDDRYYTEAEVNNELAKKLNKGAVSSDYDTAKKIEDKIKEAKRTADGKVSKAGDAMTGQLVIDTSGDSILLKEKGVNKCAIGNLYSGSASGIYNHAVGKGIVLYNDGSVSIDANNLNTNSKEVVAAINELNKDKLNKGAVSSEYDTAKKIEDKIKKIINEKWKINAKYIGDTNTSTDFNSITANGTYYSNKYNALYTNGFLGANQRAYQEFKLIVIGENNDGAPVLKSQLVITRDDNIYLRSCTSWQAPWTWSEWKKIARMSDVEEKFKNFCPYAVGDIYVTTNSSNPSTKYLGTTWSKIEGRFLLGTSGGGASKQTGGSMSKTIQQGNLPNIKLRVDSFSLTTQPHKHGIASSISVFSSNGGWRNLRLNDDGNISGSVQSLSAGGQNTGSASPQTSALGSGQALDITPSFYTTHMWLRTS